MPGPDPILHFIERFEFHRQVYILGKEEEIAVVEGSAK